MEPNTVSTKAPAKKGRLWKIITTLVVIMLAVMVGLLAWQKMKPAESNALLEDAVRAELGQLEGKSDSEIEEALNQQVEEGSMAISINAKPVFVNGSAAGSVQIENAKANHYAQNVTITRDDTGEVIYESGIIKPDEHIDTDVLDVELPQGEYPCTAIFTAYDISDGQQLEVGTVGAQITISVLS